MTAQLENRVLDYGLNELDTICDKIAICSSEPTAYSMTTAGAATQLGFKSVAAGAAFNAPADDSSFRTVSSAAITDGTITTSGSAQWWAAVDTANSRLLAHQTLSTAQSVTSGNTFTLGAFAIKIPRY